MSETELEKIVDRVTVYARVSPIDKLKIVKAWKNRGEVVAMTGDGVNDAPALKQADIGVAMGITGTEVTKDAADLVLSDDNFATILKAIERGRWIYDNIKKYLTYLLRCNITEVVVIGGIVLIKGPDHLPLLAAAILYINLATDGLPALALGIAPPDPDIMQRPPRNPRESVFSAEVKAFILMALFIETPFFYVLFFHDFADIARARTEIFFLFIIIELAHRPQLPVPAVQRLQSPAAPLAGPGHPFPGHPGRGLIQFPAIRKSFGILQPTLPMIGMILGFSDLRLSGHGSRQAGDGKKDVTGQRRAGLEVITRPSRRVPIPSWLRNPGRSRRPGARTYRGGIPFPARFCGGLPGCRSGRTPVPGRRTGK